ncbi:hypothetical protein BG006_001083 [Podila minutissima]|uniref:Uncharacterized protein n=1 Tax=Podila minutissima TaxID=64525 RepID=A0A9P5STE8_9FUNG|nr:hypothetical protein BG006_001083 [Podila minutissima]
MPTTSPSTTKGKHKGDQETNEQVDIMSDICVSTSPPTPSATAETPPPTQPKVSYIRNRDLTDLRKSPNPATRQTVVHIFRRILVLELFVLFVILLSITLRGHFSFDRMRKDVRSWMNILHVTALTDFFRVIGSVLSNSTPVRQGDHDDDDSFEPTGNLVADEIKRRGWALFPARQAPKRIPQEQGPIVDPTTVLSNYGAVASEPCPDPSSLSSASSTSTPETLPSETDSLHPVPPEPPKPTLLSVGKLAYNDKPVLLLVPGRYIIMLFVILYFVGFDIDRRHDCLQKLPDCIPANDDNPPWLVAIIVMDVFIELVYAVESVVLYRAGKQIRRLLEDMAAAKEAQVNADADVSV